MPIELTVFQTGSAFPIDNESLSLLQLHLESLLGQVLDGVLDGLPLRPVLQAWTKDSQTLLSGGIHLYSCVDIREAGRDLSLRKVQARSNLHYCSSSLALIQIPTPSRRCRLTELLPDIGAFEREDTFSACFLGFQGSNVNLCEVTNVNEGICVAQLLSCLGCVGNDGEPEQHQRGVQTSGRGCNSSKRGL
jgi:hypothetical protein